MGNSRLRSKNGTANKSSIAHTDTGIAVLTFLSIIGCKGSISFAPAQGERQIGPYFQTSWTLERRIEPLNDLVAELGGGDGIALLEEAA